MSRGRQIVAVLMIVAGSRAAYGASGFAHVRVVPGPRADAIESRYIQLLRDRIGEITTAAVTIGPLAERPDGLTILIGTLQSHPELANWAKRLGIAPPSALDPGSEGFVLASRKVGRRQVVLAIGSDRRGVLYAVGEILRT